MGNTSTNLGAFLRAQREGKQLSQRALARQVSVDPTMISHLENGTKPLGADLARGLDAVLETGGKLVELAQRAYTPTRPRMHRLQRPAQLPPRAARLFGRDAVLAQLDEAVTSTSATPILVLDGPAAVGKTAAAVYWAHGHAHRWPDGVLVTSLHGHTPNREPAEPADVLASMIADLGIHDIPDGIGARTRLLRSLLDQRRMLLILDDAACIEQITPLLPGSDGCTVLITSRRRLPGLALRFGATRITVPPLTSEAARELLVANIGQRAEGDPEAVTRIAQACSGLALAVQAAGEVIREQPGVDLAILAEYLTGPKRLQILTAAALDDPGSALRVAFAMSYRRLDTQAAQLFRLLGGHDSDTITQHQAAGLLGIPAELAEFPLATLAGENLVVPTVHGYHCPDLLRSYAAELACTHDEHVPRPRVDEQQFCTDGG